MTILDENGPSLTTLAIILEAQNLKINIEWINNNY